MKYIFALLFFMFPSLTAAHYYEGPPTKFQIGDCIKTWDKNISWYGKTAKIYDIIHSKQWRAYVYVIETSRLKRREYVYIELTDARSDKVSC